MEEQVTFMFQVGLVRDQVSTDASQMTLKTLKDLACNFINQRVSVLCPKQLSNLKHITLLFYFIWNLFRDPFYVYNYVFSKNFKFLIFLFRSID